MSSPPDEPFGASNPSPNEMRYWRYDIETDEWVELPPFPEPWKRPSIYVIGTP